MGADLNLGKLGQGVELELTVDDGLGQGAGVATFLAAEITGSECFIAEGQKCRWGRRADLVDRDTFDRRIAKLEEELRHLRELAQTPQESFVADRTLRAATERSLQLAAECALDIAHHIIAAKGWKTRVTCAR